MIYPTDYFEVYSIVRDHVKILHIFAVCAAIGSIIHCHTHTIRSLSRIISADRIESIEITHKFIFISILILWITGIIITVVQYNFQTIPVSNKLVIKISIVTLITFLALAIGGILIPFLRANEGRTFLSFSRNEVLFVGMYVGSSSALWFCVMSLAIVNAFLHMTYLEILVYVIIQIVILWIVVVALMVWIHARMMRRHISPLN